MKKRNNATFAEFVLLRAVEACGGTASFAQLSEVRIKGVSRILEGMLPTRSRQRRPVADKEAVAKKKPATSPARPSKKKLPLKKRLPLLKRTSKGGQVFYHLTIAGWKGLAKKAKNEPWYLGTASWKIEWDSDQVLIYSAGGNLIAKFNDQGARGGDCVIQGRPDHAGWLRFRVAVKQRFAIPVPQEAIPDFVRFPAGWTDGTGTEQAAGQKKGAA